MKRHFIILIILIFAARFCAMAQYFPESYTSEHRKALLYTSKVATYTKMKKIGLGLGAGGAVLTVAGITLVNSADWETTTLPNGTVNKTTDDPNGATGLIMLVAGIPMTVTGVILGIIGSNKVKSYSEKLDNLSVDLSYTPRRKGVVFTYRF